MEAFSIPLRMTQESDGLKSNLNLKRCTLLMISWDSNCVEVND